MILESLKVSASIDNDKSKPSIIEKYSELTQTCKVELFAKTVDCIQPLTIFAK